MRPEISESVIFTYTDDLPATSAFFSEIMELDLVIDQGCCHIFRLSETSLFGVCDLPDRPTGKSSLTISIVTDDVDGWYHFLRGKGVEFVRAPAYSEQFDVYSALFMSPHGYRVEIQRFGP